MVQPKQGLIYTAVHRESGTTYVGKTIKTLHERQRGHQRTIRRGIKTYFYNAVRKYGWDAFEWCELEHTFDLNEAEQFYIAYFKAIGVRLYNMTPGGDGVQEHGDTYYESIQSYWTGEKRQLQAERVTGDDNPMRDPEVVARARVAISVGCKGVKKSDEHRRNIAKAKMGTLNPMYGKKPANTLDLETSKRIAEALNFGEGVTKIARRECVSKTLVKKIKNGTHWSVRAVTTIE